MDDVENEKEVHLTAKPQFQAWGPLSCVGFREEPEPEVNSDPKQPNNIPNYFFSNVHDVQNVRGEPLGADERFGGLVSCCGSFVFSPRPE